MSLNTKLTNEMFEEAFSFAVRYFSNPDKVLKDRTGTKQRGLGQILDDQMIGKLVEYGVCKILEQNCTGKEILPDKEVKSEFDFGQPDVIQIKEDGRSDESPNLFVEIKNSPRSYQWIGVYESQFEATQNWFVQHSISSNPKDKIFIIYASLYDKFGQRVTTGNPLNDNDDWLTSEDKERIGNTKNKIVPIIVNEINCAKDMSEKILLGENLSKEEKQLFNNLDKDTITSIENFRKLKISFKKRKEDVLGSFLNHVFSDVAGRSEDFSFFFKPDDFSVGIDFVVTGSELDPVNGSGKLFPKDEIWASPEIFMEKNIFTNSNRLSANKTLFKKDTNELAEQDLIDNQTNSEPYPPQFGKITFSKPVDIYLEKRVTRRKKEDYNLNTFFVHCKQKTEASELLLGKFPLHDENKIFIKNILEGTKGRADVLIPKRNYDEIVSEQTSDRIKRIAQNI